MQGNKSIARVSAMQRIARTTQFDKIVDKIDQN
jgi:hypothetical protein